jgi:Spy/CpxP family protein refolding chaperone
MKTRTLIITLILTAVILVPLALAVPKDCPRNDQGGPGQGSRKEDRPRMGQGPGGGSLAQMLLGRMGQELNLTDEQKESIKKIAEETKTSIEEDREAVQKVMQTLREATENGTEAEIIAAGKAVGDTLTQKALNQAAVVKKVKALLTEEQLVKLEEMKAKMKERMQQRRQQMQEGDGPRHRYGNKDHHDDFGPPPQGPENEDF